jgi:glycosyltransferase involved in cell wall biosynthesis
MLGIRVGCFFHGYELRSQLLKTPGPNERKGRHSRAAEDLRHSTIRLLHDCDCVFVNSSVTGDLVYGQGRSDFNVTGCGIDDILLAECSMSYPEKRRACCAARSRLGLPSEPMTLGFLGRIVPSKNVPFLVRLLSIRKNWRLAVAGSGDVEELQCLSRELGVADRVEWLGALSENEKWDFYTALDALCLPSIMLPEGQMEGFGIVLLEATLRGTPIIVSTRGGMRDFVLDANGLYIDVDDPEESATLIDEFLCDETTVKRAVQNAQTLLATHLTYDRVAERILGDILPS